MLFAEDARNDASALRYIERRRPTREELQHIPVALRITAIEHDKVTRAIRRDTCERSSKRVAEQNTTHLGAGGHCYGNALLRTGVSIEEAKHRDVSITCTRRRFECDMLKRFHCNERTSPGPSRAGGVVAVRRAIRTICGGTASRSHLPDHRLQRSN